MDLYDRHIAGLRKKIGSSSGHLHDMMFLFIYENLSGGRDGGGSALTIISEEVASEFEVLINTGL